MAKKNDIVNWEAKEYIVRDKNVGWYIGLTVVCLLFVVLSIVLSWWSFAILVVLCGVGFGLSAGLMPRTEG